MAVYLPDTSVLIDALNGKRGRAPALRALVEDGHMLASCPVTVAEIYAGMHESEAEATSALIERLRYYDFVPEIARRAGRFKYEWARRGLTLSLADSLIAAVVVHYGLLLITDNEKHFPMPEITFYRLDEGTR